MGCKVKINLVKKEKRGKWKIPRTSWLARLVRLVSYGSNEKRFLVQ